ncbi:MAG: hydrogenase expression/formation protein HypE [Butyrivibrio sp.]|jgi:hydrogenase expression/formation protein HypE|nr:hydrogenase expression/formation protein HypE [Butyrivibrio sp.]
MKITMAHGSGGESTSELIRQIFAKHFHNEVLDRMEDSAIVPGNGRIAMTTDSFVVTPYFFPGGDIGRLSVCGTVNDLLMSGSVPKYLTCGCILEEGMDMDDLDRIIASMAETAREAGVEIITGDTKVVEARTGKGGLMINTAGVGFARDGAQCEPSQCADSDAVILSGTLGEHHAAILGSRMGIHNNIVSDAAPLVEMVNGLMNAGIHVHAMRDVTRGGLGTVLNEFASASACCMNLQEKDLPVSDQVRDFCGILGLDPMYMGNEGKMVAIVPKEEEEAAVKIIRGSRYGENAAVIGHVEKNADTTPAVVLHTQIGGRRVIGLMYGEGLPRIC